MLSTHSKTNLFNIIMLPGNSFNFDRSKLLLTDTELITKHQTRKRNSFCHFVVCLIQAVNLDKVNVKGYTAWTLTDRFDLINGFSSPFGLYYVNMSDPSHTRVPKSSAGFYR